MLPRALGHKDVDRHPKKLTRGIAEEHLNLAIRYADEPIAVDKDDRVRHCFEQRFVDPLALFIALVSPDISQGH